MKFAKIVFWIAGIWGILVLTPLLFIYNLIGRQDPPPITHPAFYYGFVTCGLAWQVAFLVHCAGPGSLAPADYPFSSGKIWLRRSADCSFHPAPPSRQRSCARPGRRAVWRAFHNFISQDLVAVRLARFSLAVENDEASMGDLMHRRSFLKTTGVAGIATGFSSLLTVESQSSKANPSTHVATAARTATTTHPTIDSPNKILLKDYRPKSIYKIPVTEVAKAKFSIIDMHSHPYAKTAEEIAQWVRNMDEVGVDKTVIPTMATGNQFDEINRKYSKYPERFEMWCGFDFTGYDKPTFPATAVKELERCRKAGARGVGEIHDKGKGLRS